MSDRVTPDTLPHALERIDEIHARTRGRRLAVLLDYDGTLSPIADRPELATLPAPMREAVANLARNASVAIVSGRDVRDIRRLVALPGIYYIGSHGFEMEGPESQRLDDDPGTPFLPALDSAEQELREHLNSIEGALVERKRFSVAVHYRLVSNEDRPKLERAVAATSERYPNLRRGAGKMVHELRPDIDWHKGKAVLRLLEILDHDVLPIYIGDDVTDEDAFRALQDRGVGVVVCEEPHPTAAAYRLAGTEEVRALLQKLAG